MHGSNDFIRWQQKREDKMSHDEITPAYKEIDGFIVPAIFSVNLYKSGLNYKPRDDDVFIVAYPKCGTNWMQNIVGNIYRRGKQYETGAEFHRQNPFLLSLGAESAKEIKRPGTIKMHLPFHMTPYNSMAKYIFITRNPKDCCVSLYHYLKNSSFMRFKDGKFNAFFELFIAGKVAYGDYFDHLLSWYEHRNDSNVLFITYEEMKKDMEQSILKIAEFLDLKYKEDLLKDKCFLDTVMKHSSFSFMKENFSQRMDELYSMSKESILSDATITDPLKKWLLSASNRQTGQKREFVRKGIVGDWRNHFSEDQNARLEAKFKEKTEGTDIPKLWKDCMF